MASDDLDRALAGNQEALHTLVIGIQDLVYNLALRMLWHPEDARDATQEILIRIVTHLDSFERHCAFTTWVYRVACNYLLTTRRRRAEQAEVTFESFAQGLAIGSDDDSAMPDQERVVLVEEVKIGCTQAMLLALDRDHRLAFILSEIVGLDGEVGAAVLEIEPVAFRKRLSRARERLGKFMQSHCGLANQKAPCRCDRRIGAAIARGHVNPSMLLFAGRLQVNPSCAAVLESTAELNGFEAAGQVLRSNPHYATPESVIDSLHALLDSRSFQILQ